MRQNLVIRFDPAQNDFKAVPRFGKPGFEVAFAEAQMFLNFRLAGGSKRVLKKMLREFDATRVAIVLWMIAEIDSATASALYGANDNDPILH